MRKIARAFKTTPITALEAELGLPPADLRLHRIQHAYATHLLTLPENLPVLELCPDTFPKTFISKNKVVSGVATQSQELSYQSFVSGVTSAPGGKETGTTATGDRGYLRCLAWTSELDEGTHETIEEIFVSSGTMYCHSVTPEACYPDSWSSEFKYLDD